MEKINIVGIFFIRKRDFSISNIWIKCYSTEKVCCFARITEDCFMAMLLIIVSVCTSLAEGIFIKKYNSRHSKGGFLFTGLISLFSMMYFIVTNTDGFYCPAEVIPYAVIAGILYCSASFLTYVALSCGSFAMSMLILSYGIVFSIGYGIIFLKEPATLYTYIGLAIIMVSLYLVRGAKDASGKKFSVKWLVCILLSVFGSGMFGVIQRMQQIRFENSCTNEFMIIALGLSAAALLIVGFIKDGKDLKYIVKNGSLYAILAGFSNGATNGLSLIVNTMIAISIASPTRAGVKIILSFIMSKLIFKEDFLKRQIVGILLGAVGLVFLNI